jgi:hypothetical protein
MIGISSNAVFAVRASCTSSLLDMVNCRVIESSFSRVAASCELVDRLFLCLVDEGCDDYNLRSGNDEDRGGIGGSGGDLEPESDDLGPLQWIPARI